MNVEILPEQLRLWMFERGFVWRKKDAGKPNWLDEDEVYNAAIELLGDMQEEGNVWCDETTASEKATVKRFVAREGRTHRRLDLGEWYDKGD